MRVGLKCATMEYGGPCVTMAGMLKIQQLCAGS